MRTARVAGVLALLAVAGCASRQPEPGPRPPAAPERPAERPLPTAAYVERVASIDLYMIRAGELALQRSADAGIRAYAGRMIAEHRGLATQLSMAGRRLNLLPPTTLQPEQQAWLDALTAAAQFDATYRRQQVAAHEASYRIHYAFAFSGDSPTLRMTARSAAAIELEHGRAMRTM